MNIEEQKQKITILSDGNPGAMNAIILVMRSGLDPLNQLEKANIKGEQIYILFNDVCKRNVADFILVMAGIDYDIISNDVLLRTIEGEKGLIDFRALAFHVAEHIFKTQFKGIQNETN